MKIKFAIIGFGHIGRKHYNTLLGNAEAEVVAICDPYLEEESIDGIPVFKDIEQMLISIPEIDVVNICTPNGLHAEQSIICINAVSYTHLTLPTSDLV